jgi:U32 family peptidase
MKEHIELLAPAGNQAALHAAVTAGADAVYLGLGSFNARRNAENFTYESLGEACAYAHARGVRIYVALNTAILPGELPSALECARQAWRAGADAFIVQDIGLAFELHRTLPEAELHASTQMNIHDGAGLEVAALLGCKRVTLSRELSVEEIAFLCEVAEQLGMEVEVFAHGALCVCYSGQCLMSSMIGGRSANRGTCAQPCRLPYQLFRSGQEKPLKTPGEHLLSPRDLCSVGLLPELRRAGVASLKIEGRMKSPDYVASVVRVYRAVLDRLEAGQDATPTHEERQALSEAFSRGFTTAYLENCRDNEMMSYQRPNNRGVPAGRIERVGKTALFLKPSLDICEGDVLEIWTGRGRAVQEISALDFDKKGLLCIPVREGDREARAVRAGDRVFRVRSAQAAFDDDAMEPRLPVRGVVNARIGEPLAIEFCLADSRYRRRLGEAGQAEGAAEGPIVEAARTKAVTDEDIRSHVDRLGNTPFVLEHLDVNLDEGVGLGFSAIHRVRADALENLLSALGGTAQKRVLPKVEPHSVVYPVTFPRCKVTALVANPACARAARRAGADVVYVHALNYKRGSAMMAGRAVDSVEQAGYPKGCAIALPAIAHEMLENTRETVRDIDVWEYVKEGQTILVDSAASLLRADDKGALPEVGPHVPITNKVSLEVVSSWGAQRVWLSPELTLHQIADMTEGGSPVPVGLTIIGAQELMVTEHCVLMSQAPCNEDCAHCPRRKAIYYLKDRKGYNFPVFTDAMGRSHIYNSVALDIAAFVPDLIKAGVSALMVDATLMSAEETAQAVGRAVRARDIGERDGNAVSKVSNATTGHLFRGVQ